jgi:hypothetical protein
MTDSVDYVFQQGIPFVLTGSINMGVFGPEEFGFYSFRVDPSEPLYHFFVGDIILVTINYSHATLDNDANLSPTDNVVMEIETLSRCEIISNGYVYNLDSKPNKVWANQISAVLRITQNTEVGHPAKFRLKNPGVGYVMGVGSVNSTITALVAPVGQYMRSR